MAMFSIACACLRVCFSFYYLGDGF